ncbi:hypothetical protein LW347_04835 [Pectobacterium polonicum]|uniref:Uncharacterized protein n=1 Tax=Pectobacterium polonicum TaxID=2485124 RepID=A0AAE9T0W3_9GAMM|nr:hypothetical protein [Pectobacterium polonicum]UVO09306.1 hypothetical protein LW347_04835 [Pectobacterium polonicum]
MANSKTKPYGYWRRHLLFFITWLLLITLLMLLAAVLFENDPDGQGIKVWLHDSRYILLAWRMMVYAGLAWLWFYAVRPRLIAATASPAYLMRLEWLAAGFLLFIELANLRALVA